MTALKHMWRLFCAILAKETKNAMRESKSQTVASIVIMVAFQFYLMIRWTRMWNINGAISGATLMLIYTSVMLIPVIANPILIKGFLQERASGSLMLIFAAGINPGLFWVMRTIAVFCYAYVISIFIMEMDIVVMTFVLQNPPTFSFLTVLMIFVISPLAALAFIAVMSYMYLTVKCGHLFAGILPALVIVLLLGFSYASPSWAVLVAGAIAAGLAAVGILFICGYLINRIGKPRILNL